MNKTQWIIIAAASAGLTSAANAGVTITPGTSAPTYAGFALDFDQAGDPPADFGAISQTHWQGSHGIETVAGDPVMLGGQVYGWDGLYSFGGSGNSLRGPFGMTFNFDSDIMALSFQAFSDAGAPSPFFGGGMYVRAYNDGTLLAEVQVTPAWGGVGDDWFDVVSDSGGFDQVWLSPSGGGNQVMVDNMSWTVPAPGSLALLGLTGLAVRRRR